MASELIIRSGFSSDFSEIGAVDEIKHQIGEGGSGTLFFFSSGPYNQSTLNGAMLAAFPDALRIGLASHAGFNGHSFQRAGISALYLESPHLMVTAHLAEKISQDPFRSPKSAVLRSFEDFAIDPLDLDIKRNFGLMFDGASPAKRDFMLAGISEIAPWLTMAGVSSPFVGFLHHSPTQVGIVHLGTQIATDAAVFVLVHTEHPWRVMRYHPYRPSGRSVMVTSSNPRKFVLQELNGRSAVEELTFLLDGNLRQKAYQSLDGLLEYPLGIKVGREHFIRAVARFDADGQLQTLGSMLSEGLTLDLMAPGDEKLAVEAFTKEVSAKLGELSGALLFGSLAQIKEADLALAPVLEGIPTAGGAGIYQLYNGMNLGNTLTVVGFGS